MAVRSYNELRIRIDDLARTLLPSPSITGSYSVREQDATRAFVLLTHAELESFCEELALHVVKEAQNRSIPSRCYPLISRLVVYYAAAKNKEFEVLDEELIEEACDFYRAAVENNHGIKRRNLLRLFLPLGLNHHDFDETMLATLDAFGGRRGEFAHRSFKTHQPLDPVSEKARVVNLLMPEIKRVDDLTRALVRHKI